MSSLAERKVKQKISRDPQNKFWQNDQSKFGQKMLEKMGWKNGSGLGLKQQGVADPISLSANMATRGLGCDATAEHNWVAHQDNFDDLLAQLNSDNNNKYSANNDTIGKECDERLLLDPETIVVVEKFGGAADCRIGSAELDSAICDSKSRPMTMSESVEKSRKSFSLEQKSKSSRARLHYHKFARGKDLSLASASDMDAIMGRSVRNPRRHKMNFESEKIFQSDSEKINTQLFINNSVNMADYFKNKMAAKVGDGSVSLALPRESDRVEKTEADDSLMKIDGFSVYDGDFAMNNKQIGSIDFLHVTTDRMLKQKGKKRNRSHVCGSDSVRPEIETIRKKIKKSKKRTS